MIDNKHKLQQPIFLDILLYRFLSLQFLAQLLFIIQLLCAHNFSISNHDLYNEKIIDQHHSH